MNKKTAGPRDPIGFKARTAQFLTGIVNLAVVDVNRPLNRVCGSASHGDDRRS